MGAPQAHGGHTAGVSLPLASAGRELGQDPGGGGGSVPHHFVRPTILGVSSVISPVGWAGWGSET